MNTRRERIVAGLDRGDRPGELAGSLCRSCNRLAGVTGTAVTTLSGQPPGRAHPVLFATSAAARRVCDAQSATGQGPGIDAVTTRAPVMIVDMQGVRDRWPRFVQTLAPVMVQAVFAFPLQVGAARLGALGLYRDTPGPLSTDALADALVCADLMTEALLGGSRQRLAPLQLEPAGSHARLAEATGRVMVQLQVSATVALLRLRAHADATGVPVTEVADQVNSHRLRLGVDPS